MSARVVELLQKNSPKLSGFDLFWEAYPKKKAKGDAVKAWLQTAKIRPPIEAMIAAIENEKKSVQWQRDGGEYIPYPATYLRNWGWLNE